MEERPDKFAAMSKLVYGWYDRVGRNMNEFFYKTVIIRLKSLFLPQILTLNNSACCPNTSAFMCFVRISEQTAIISLYSMNWSVFITEKECLLCGTDWIFKYNSGWDSS
jgi:hypothetical protein